MDNKLAGVTVIQFRQALRDAADRILVVQPVLLREPISLWLRSVEERAAREHWTELLGRSVLEPWNAAQAILNEHARRAGHQGDNPAGRG